MDRLNYPPKRIPQKLLFTIDFDSWPCGNAKHLLSSRVARSGQAKQIVYRVTHGCVNDYLAMNTSSVVPAFYEGPKQFSYEGPRTKALTNTKHTISLDSYNINK